LLAAESPRVAAAAAAAVTEAIEMLAGHPFLGRPLERGFRELVISRGRTGSVALYRFREERELIVVLSIRHQRELS